MIYTCPATGVRFQVPDRHRAYLNQTELDQGPEWVNAELHRLGTPIADPGWIRDAVEWRDDPAERPEHINLKAFQRTEEKKMAHSAPQPALTFPIIPEVREDGTKKLYKTRYSELELKYSQLYHKFQITMSTLSKLQLTQDALEHEHAKLKNSAAKMETKLADSDRLDKRIKLICSEIKLQMPNTPRWELGMSLEQKLDTFFGAVLCRIRNEEELDELAD